MKVKMITAALAVAAIGVGAAPAVARTRPSESRVEQMVRLGLNRKLSVMRGSSGARVQSVRCRYRFSYPPPRSGYCEGDLTRGVRAGPITYLYSFSARFATFSDGSFEWSADFR